VIPRSISLNKGDLLARDREGCRERKRRKGRRKQGKELEGKEGREGSCEYSSSVYSIWWSWDQIAY